MKKTILTLFGLLLTLVLTSSTTYHLDSIEPAKVLLTCGPPSDFYLVKVGTGKPLFPGMHPLSPNTQYKVYVESTQGWACVDPGSGYSITYKGCEDVTPGTITYVGNITTASNISSGVTVNVGLSCFPGTWTGGFPYDGL